MFHAVALAATLSRRKSVRSYPSGNLPLQKYWRLLHNVGALVSASVDALTSASTDALRVFMQQS